VDGSFCTALETLPLKSSFQILILKRTPPRNMRAKKPRPTIPFPDRLRAASNKYRKWRNAIARAIRNFFNPSARHTTYETQLAQADMAFNSV
jgi:hypothetical protein